MARFKLCLIGSSQPLHVDMPVSDVAALAELASRARFLRGNMAEPDEEGVCVGVMIPTSRIQCVFEAS